jgi:hypothetical protein
MDKVLLTFMRTKYCADGVRLEMQCKFFPVREALPANVPHARLRLTSSAFLDQGAMDSQRPHRPGRGSHVNA